MYDGKTAIIQAEDAYMTVMEAFTVRLSKNDAVKIKEKEELCRNQ
jgi:hypothetical protein